MKAVVDTNVVAYYLLGTQPFVEEVRQFWRTVEEPCAPTHWEAELANAVFKTPQGHAGPPVAVPNGFVLFRVLTRNEASRDAFASQKDQLRESIRSREADRLTRAYLQQIRSERKVEVNDQLLASFLKDTGNGRRS